MTKQLLLGTRNLARVEMFRHILRDTGVRVITLADLGIAQEVEEDGASAEANARKKAEVYYALSGVPTLAVDGGLHIDRFPPEEQPGTLVKRLPGIGPRASDRDVLDYYMRALEKVGGESPGTWTGSQALALSAEQVLFNTFRFEVWFTMHPKGDIAPGRALDSLMVDPASGRYYTDLAMEERPYYQATRDFVLSCVEKLPG